MKALIVFLVLALSTASQALDKYDSMGEISGPYSIFCTSRSGEPKLHFTFQTQSPFGGMAASMIIIKTGEGAYVRDWPPTTTMITPWYLFPSFDSVTGKRNLSITGNIYSLYNETVELKINDSSSGKFDGTFKYWNNSPAPVRADRNVRCSILNGNFQP